MDYNLICNQNRGVAVSKLFSNHSFSSEIYIHKKLPIYKTNEFDFYRSVKFEDSFYGKTVSELHHGNLRLSNIGRYSKLFPNEKISYWADSIATVQAEMKIRNSGKNRLTFWAYDDASSSFPTSRDQEQLIIIDGIDLEFYCILKKIEDNQELTNQEQKTVLLIAEEKPDCLAYKSVRHMNGVNFLFFEKGFQKLSIRQVKLRLGDMPSKNKNTIICSGTSDYLPYVENYGMYFSPIAKINDNKHYEQSDEYNSRKKVYYESRIDLVNNPDPVV